MALRTEFLCAVINDFGAKESIFFEICFCVSQAFFRNLFNTKRGTDFCVRTPLAGIFISLNYPIIYPQNEIEVILLVIVEIHIFFHVSVDNHSIPIQ